MQLNDLAAICDIGDVDGDSLAVDDDAAALRRRRAESDAQKIGRRLVGAADYDGLMGVPNLDILPAGENL